MGHVLSSPVPAVGYGHPHVRPLTRTRIPPAMRETSLLEINLAAVSQNLRLLKRIVGDACRLCPIVKADAYGLGAPRIARTLIGAGADMLAVYDPAEATELLKRAITAPILILMPVREIDRLDEIYRSLICRRLHLTVHDEAHLDDLIAVAERFGAAIPVHLEVDTGMSRGGCDAEGAPALIERIRRHPRLQLAGLYTHFAHAESDLEFTDRQFRQFNEIVDHANEFIPEDCLIHCASTFATLRAQRYHRSMIRIGLAWAGYGLEMIEGGEIIIEGEKLQPAVVWKSHLVQVRRVPKGRTIGYSATWTAPRDTVMGVVPVGYADGYPMNLGASDTKLARNTPGGMVRLRVETGGGTELCDAPVVGAVNMDQITIDLTDAVARFGRDAVDVGSTIELISDDRAAPNHLPALAERGGTFAHEMLCRLNPRLKREYVLREPVQIEVGVAEKVVAAG